MAKASHCRICRGPHSRIVHRIQKLPARKLPKGYRWGRRRNPAAMDGHVFVVIAHGKNGEVAYRGREAHLTYGAAWREAQIVARRRGLTDVHIVKDGKDIVGEVKARTNPSAGDRYRMVHSRPHGWHHLWNVVDTRTGKVLVEDETYASATQAVEAYNGRTRGVVGEIREWARPNPKRRRAACRRRRM